VVGGVVIGGVVVVGWVVLVAVVGIGSDALVGDGTARREVAVHPMASPTAQAPAANGFQRMLSLQLGCFSLRAG
jgi:hypothetical protein